MDPVELVKKMPARVQHGTEAAALFIVLHVEHIGRRKLRAIQESLIARAQVMIKRREQAIAVTGFFRALPPRDIPLAPPFAPPQRAPPLMIEQPARGALHDI